MLYDQLGRDDSGPRALTAQVMVSLRRMEALTLNFLDLNRVESHGIKVFPQRASLNDVVGDLLESCGPAVELKRLRLDVDLDPTLELFSFDPLQVQRALGNLVDNAVKFTPEGGTIAIRTLRCNGDAEVVIGDSGPGIATDRVGTLFTRFQNGRDSGGRRSTGLGLYIAAAIVTAHGGTIEVDREDRQGTWFTITLPMRPPEEPERAAESPAPLAVAAG